MPRRAVYSAAVSSLVMLSLASQLKAQRPQARQRQLPPPAAFLASEGPRIQRELTEGAAPRRAWLLYAQAVGMNGDSLLALEVLGRIYLGADSGLRYEVRAGLWQYGSDPATGAYWARSNEQALRLDLIQVALSALFPGDPWLLAEAADVAMRADDHESALRFLDSAIGIHSDSVLELKRAKVYLASGRTSLARAAYSEQYARSPRWQDACWGLEEFHATLGEARQSGEMSYNCLRNVGISLEYYVDSDTAIARVVAAGRHSALIAALRDQISGDHTEGNSTRVERRRLLAEVFEAIGDTAAALEPRRAQLSLCQTYCSDVHFSLGRELFSLERYEEALRSFERAFALDTTNASALFNQGASLGHLGKDSAARHAYAKYVVLRPDNAEGWVRLGYISALLGDSRRSARFFEKALELQPGIFDDRQLIRELWEEATRAAGRQPSATIAEVRALLSASGRVAAGRPRQSTVQGSDAIAATGSGFAVGDGGTIVTNAHVVAGCKRIVLVDAGNQSQDATVVALDRANDLALLTVQRKFSTTLRLRAEPVQVGSPVVALGFPMRGTLADQVIVTSGIVSALAGIGNDSRLIQTTAAVQPGNSGGPLLDQSGRVVGVVMGKLDAARVFALQGTIPEGIGFAIKAGSLREFARSYQIGVADGTTSRRLETDSLVSVARNAVVLIQCRR